MTSLIDGDLDFLRKIYYKAVSYLRKLNVPIPPLSEYNKMKEEASKYKVRIHEDEKIKKDVEDMVNDELKQNLGTKRLLEEAADAN